MEEQKKEALNQILQMVEESNRIVFFGGAGVSTESGVPDFRSKDGLYNQHDVQFDAFSPEYLLSHSCLYQNPKVFYEFYRQKMDARHVKPNVTHRVLAKLEEMGKVSAVVTQNIDGLHQKAGSKRVYEIHGSTLRNYCAGCGAEYDADFIYESKDAIPRCPRCGGKVRPDVTLYEESLPDFAVEKAMQAIREADMLIIGGTSLKVYPAAGFIYGFQGKNLAVINKENLGVSMKANLAEYQGALGEVFAEIEKKLL